MELWEANCVGLEHHSKSSVIGELVHHAVSLGYLRRRDEAPIMRRDHPYSSEHRWPWARDALGRWWPACIRIGSKQAFLPGPPIFT